MTQRQPNGAHPDDEDLFAWAAGDSADAAEPVPVATRARAVALFAGAPFLTPAPDPLSAAREAIGRVRRLVAAVTFDSWGTLAPGFAGVRGAASGERQLSWVAGDLEVDLQATRHADGSWMLLGQVAAPEGTAIRAVELAPAGSADDPAVAAAPDEFGGFDLAAGPGAWDVLVRLDDALVVLPGLEVG